MVFRNELRSQKLVADLAIRVYAVKFRGAFHFHKMLVHLVAVNNTCNKSTEKCKSWCLTRIDLIQHVCESKQSGKDIH